MSPVHNRQSSAANDPVSGPDESALESRIFPPEPPLDACRAIAHQFEQVMRGAPSPTSDQITLMLTDYASRAAYLRDSEVNDLDRKVFSAMTKPDPRAAGSSGRDVVPTDVAVLTVLPEELDACLHVFEADGQHPHHESESGRRFFRTSIEARLARRTLSVVITDAGRSGTVEVAPAVHELSDHYKPRQWFLVGIAAGHRKHLRIGDVVVPESVHHYDPARITDGGEQSRFEHINVPTSLFNALRYYRPDEGRYAEMVQAFLSYAADNYRLTEIPPEFLPSIKMRNIVVASGTKVSRSEAFMDRLLDLNDKFRAVDMESYGFGRTCDGGQWAVLRGISDHGDAADSGASEDLTFAATGLAALCLRDFLETKWLS